MPKSKKTTPITENLEAAAPEAPPRPFGQPVIAAAQLAMQKTGCPASLAIAQFGLESGWGKTVTGNFNYFGIEWEPECRYPFKSKPTEQGPGADVPEVDKFISFPNMQAAFDYHGSLIMSPSPTSPYHSALVTWQRSKDVFKMADMLGHYAEDRSYAVKLREILSDYQLPQFDQLPAEAVSSQ